MGFFETYKKEIAAVLILVTLIGVLITVDKVITANAVKEQKAQENYSDWLADNCECTARERLKCGPGFELVDGERLCVKDAEGKKVYTNVILGCSEYTCEDFVVTWNVDTNKWGPVINR
jgi:hypothetical protein